MQSSKEEQEEVKKGFLSERCKETGENNTRGPKRWGPNRSRDINRRCPEHTEELYKKDLHDTDNLYGVITHPEPDILECKVK